MLFRKMSSVLKNKVWPIIMALFSILGGFASIKTLFFENRTINVEKNVVNINVEIHDDYKDYEDAATFFQKLSIQHYSPVPLETLRKFSHKQKLDVLRSIESQMKRQVGRFPTFLLKIFWIPFRVMSWWVQIIFLLFICSSIIVFVYSLLPAVDFYSGMYIYIIAEVAFFFWLIYYMLIVFGI